MNINSGLHISHEKGNVYFNLRTCGIAIRDGRVLGVKIAPYDFWLFPGGRVEYMEPSSVALKREIQEELSTPCEVVKLLWAVEDFYSFEKQDTHELCYYYLIEFPDGSEIYNKTDPWTVIEKEKEHETEKKLTFHWIPISSLNSVHFIPKYVVAQLGALPEEAKFLIMNHVKNEGGM